jgi:hypothetical protein
MQNKIRASSRAAGWREQGSCPFDPAHPPSSPRGVIVAMNCGPKINKRDDEFPMSLFACTQQ